MLSLEAEQRQERLRSLAETWVCAQGQEDCSALHWAPPLQALSAAPGPLCLSAPAPVVDSDGTPPADGGAFLGPLRSGHSAVDSAVGTLSFLGWRIQSVCHQVRNHLPTLLAIGIVPPGLEGCEEGAAHGEDTRGSSEGPKGVKGGSSQEGGQATTETAAEGKSGGAEARQDGTHQEGSPPHQEVEESPPTESVIPEGGSDAQGDDRENGGASHDGPSGGSAPAGEAEARQQAGNQDTSQETIKNKGGAPEQAYTFLRGAGSIPGGGGAHQETAALLACLRSLAYLLGELSRLVCNTLLQLHCLYPAPPAAQGFWGALPLWGATAGASGKPPGAPQVPPLFLKFPGRVHLPPVAASLAEAAATLLTVDEALRFNSAVSHGLSSYQQLLSSAAQALQRNPSAVPGATWASVQALLHGVGRLTDQVLPRGGLFARLCAEVRAQGLAATGGGEGDLGAPQPGGPFPNASAVLEILSVAGPSLSHLLLQIPDAPTTPGTLPRGPPAAGVAAGGLSLGADFGSEVPLTRPLIAGHVGLMCLLCSQLAPLDRAVLAPRGGDTSAGALSGALAPKKLAQLLLPAWEAAEKLPLLHLWGPVATSPLELLAAHVPPVVYPHVPRPLAALAQAPGVGGGSAAAWRGVLLQQRRAALQGVAAQLARSSGACCARLTAVSTQLRFPAQGESHVAEAAVARTRLLLEGVHLTQWAAREVQLLLDLHALLQTPLAAARVAPLLALLLAAQSFAATAQGCAGETLVSQPLVWEHAVERLRGALGAVRAGVEQAQAREASGAYGAFFGAVAGAGSGSGSASGRGAQQTAQGPYHQGQPSGGVAGGVPGGLRGDSDASSTASRDSGLSGDRKALFPPPPAPLALLAVCEAALQAPATLQGTAPSRHALAVSIHILLGVASASDERKKDLLTAWQGLEELADVETLLGQGQGQGGASLGASLGFLLWQQQQLLPVLLRTLWGQLTGALPSAETGVWALCTPGAPLPEMRLQLLLDCFVGALGTLRALPMRALAAAALGRFEGDIRGSVEEAVVGPLVKDVEADVRLHVHSVRLGPASVGVNPRRTGLRDLTRLLALPPLRLATSSLSLAGAAEEHLTRTLFNQALVSPLGAQRAYREMQHLAVAKYGLRLVPLPLLLPPGATPAPGGTTASATNPAPSSGKGQPRGPGALPAAAERSLFGSLGWVLANLDSFVAEFGYDAARHVFRERGGVGRAKVREVRGAQWAQELQQPLAGAPLLARAEEATARLGASCLQQLLHALTHDTVKTLLLKEARYWGSAETQPSTGSRGQGSAPNVRTVGSPYPLPRAEAVLAGLGKVSIRRDALGGREGVGRLGAKEGQAGSTPILEVCADLVSRLGVLSALLEALSTAAPVGTDGSQGGSQEHGQRRSHLSAVLGLLRRAVQASPCPHFFLLVPCITLHHVRSQATGDLQTQGGPLSGEASGRSSSGVPGAGGGRPGDEFGAGLALVQAAWRQEVRGRHLRWFPGVRGTLGSQLSSAEAELRTCQPPPEHHLWGKPVEVLNPERALHLQGVIQGTRQMLECFTRLEAMITRTSSIMEA